LIHSKGTTTHKQSLNFFSRYCTHHPRGFYRPIGRVIFSVYLQLIPEKQVEQQDMPNHVPHLSWKDQQWMITSLLCQ